MPAHNTLPSIGLTSHLLYADVLDIQVAITPAALAPARLARVSEPLLVFQPFFSDFCLANTGVTV
jgi:hypothetical protein